MPTKVIMITNAVAPDKLGGLERYVRELAAALVRIGVDTSVIAKRISADDADTEIGADGVRIIRHVVPSKKDPFFAAKYSRYVRAGVGAALDDHPDAVIHGHFPVPMLSLRRPGRRIRRPYLYTFHAPVHREILSERQDSYLLPRPVQKPVIRYFRHTEASVVANASRVTVLSDFMRGQLAELAPAAADRAALIPGGIDTSAFSLGDGEVAHDPESPILFTARRLTPRTGVPTLVSAMRIVTRRFPGAHLAIAGDGLLRGEIEQQIIDLGLQDNVTLLGRISEESLVEWYRKATFTVMPTAALEGFGLTTAESLACGTPVLVTPVGANPELVRDLDPRFVTRGADAESIADGIVELLSSRDTVLKARGHLRRSSQPNPWSWDSVAKRYVGLYEQHSESLR